MICSNCKKKYHWCPNCYWPAGKFACSHKCATSLYSNDLISKEQMSEWDEEEAWNKLAKRSRGSRVGRTIKREK